MMIFKGDMPALQFEAGQQKGGDVFCWSCPIKANLCPNISYSYSLPYIDRTTKIMYVFNPIKVA